jgi:hypothetical protein
LLERRNTIKSEQELPLRVPRWSDPTIIVTYRPVTREELQALYDAVERAQERDRGEVAFDGRIKLLAKCCKGVLLRFEDGSEQSFSNFGGGLATLFELEGSSALDVAREVFIADGDVLNHYDRLTTFSASADQKLDEVFKGE